MSSDEDKDRHATSDTRARKPTTEAEPADEIFTSAEYDLGLLANEKLRASTTSSMEIEPSVSAGHTSNHKHRSPELETDAAQSANAQTESKNTLSGQVMRQVVAESSSLEQIVHRESRSGVPKEKSISQTDRTDPPGPTSLPGKDTQSVVVNMGQLNEDAERSIKEKLRKERHSPRWRVAARWRELRSRIWLPTRHQRKRQPSRSKHQTPTASLNTIVRPTRWKNP